MLFKAPLNNVLVSDYLFIFSKYLYLSKTRFLCQYYVKLKRKEKVKFIHTKISNRGSYKFR